MSTNTCLLCQGKKVSELSTINRKELLRLYYKLAKADFGYLVPSDVKCLECDDCKLIFYTPTIPGDEFFYNTLQGFDWYYLKNKEEYQFANKYIDANDKVLDVGCGSGEFAKISNSKNYVGLEFSAVAKEMAEKQGIVIENLSIEEYSSMHPNSFDVVASFQVLEHVSNPNEFIASKLKSLKTGGKMIVGVPSNNSYLQFVSNNILNMPPHHMTKWSDQTFHFIAKFHNLKILELYHEPVQEIHKQQYLSSMVLNGLGIKTKPIDSSLRSKIVRRVSALVAKVFFRKLHRVFQGHGHTVVAVFEKL